MGESVSVMYKSCGSVNFAKYSVYILYRSFCLLSYSSIYLFIFYIYQFIVYYCVVSYIATCLSNKVAVI